MLLAFDTDQVIPPGGGRDGYVVTSAEVTLQVSNNLVFRHDFTADPWTCFLPSADPRLTADADAGQPVELYGVGFRGGWSAATFLENSAFANAGASFLSPGVRNAFAAQVDAQGQPSDVSNNPRVGFQPKPFGIGRVNGLAAGALVPQDSILRFQVDVSDAGIQNYLRDGIDRGRLFLSVSSLTLVQQQAGDFPVFYSKENAFVSFGLAQPPRLRLKVDTAPACEQADLDCSGRVDLGDISFVLLDYGPCAGCVTDLDGTGEVDFGDVMLVLMAFN